MGSKLKVLLSLFVILFIANSIFGQVMISKTQVDYSLKIEQDSIYRILTFWKHKDSTIYTSIKYSISDFNENSNPKNLADEIVYIEQLWNIAQDSISMNLKSIIIGYPQVYKDILQNHIEAFKQSKEWQSHVNENGKTLNIELIKKIMFESDMYKPLNDLLRTKGYQVSGFETEKHGFITKENQLKAGYSGQEIIPMPFMVWITITQP